MKDPEIERLQQQRNHYRRLAHQLQDENNWAQFRNARNNLKRTIRKTKSTLFKKALSSKRPKEVWKTIKRLLSPNNRVIKADPEVLNQHYVTLAEKISPTKADPFDPSQLPANIDNGNDFQFTPTTINDIEKAIKELRDDCSTGFDQIPVKYIKPVSEFLSSPLTHIINNCISNNVFPDQWKIARISPIPKIDNPKDPVDYRPVSVLPILSKVFEKIMMKQMANHIERKLASTQSGFRPGHSTVTLLLKMKDEIHKSINRGEITLAALADFSKAFDTVNHHILLRKLELLNFSKNSILLIQSYLMERKQFVQINDRKSTLEEISYGVPQGSILGPVLFNLYVADMKPVVQSTCFQYADDTNILRHCKPKSIKACSQELETDLTTLHQWSTSNNLVFNKTKTKSMLFATSAMMKRHDLENESVYSISINGQKLERIKTSKILGVHFNQNLTWEDHFSKLLSSCYSKLRILRKIKRIAPFNIRKSLAETMIMSRIDYANTVTYNITNTLKRRLQKLQNSAASFVIGRFLKSSDILQLNWLPISERLDLSMAKLAYKSLHFENFPSNLKNELYTNDRNLRETNERQFTIRSSNSPGTFNYYACKVFNDLPLGCRNVEHYNEFTRKTKSYFFDRAIALNLS